jgi:3-oxoadipate enol-lactonase
VPYTVTRPRLYYERHGSGTPLLFITGFAISSAVLAPVIDIYADRFDCIVYDNRNSGRSQAPLRPTSIPALAGDAATLLDALGLESAHVYGVSMGGMIAQELALRFPERVRGLVLGCTTPGGPQAARPGLADLRRLADPSPRELRDPLAGWPASLLFSPRFRCEQPDQVRRLLKLFFVHRPPPHGIAAHWWASFFHDTVSRLDQIQSPTLVIHGELDAMSPLANSVLLADRIPDAELQILAGAGHAYALESPRESLEVLVAWLRRREPIAPGEPRAGALAAAEPLTRALGLPIGMARTGASLARVTRTRLSL